ncbi:deoxyuridine 5'-triphosphate nucleotidohydrolase isoform X3 [Triticum aestivum]|nr:deoxyuridine 5'-triphosphate nucleotidohydrolase-like isoform X3 [Triticum aestivum]
MSSPSLPLSDPWRDPLPCTRSAGRTRAQPSSTTRPTRPIASTSPGCSPPRRGGAVTPRASLVAARTAMEEAVYEVVLRQAALVEDLQGRGAAREAEAGRRRWRDEQLEQKGNVELGIQKEGSWPSSRLGAVSSLDSTRRGPGLLTPRATRVIDADYHNELCAVLFNHSEADFTVKLGDCIAQMIVQVIATPEVTEVEGLNATARREGGFVSNGV